MRPDAYNKNILLQIGECGRFDMNYITIKQAAANWNISVRWVQKLCQDNRIEGAQYIGRVWLLPKDAERPGDSRKTRYMKGGGERDPGGKER